MKTCLLPENGSFYKANLHMHTAISDGKMTPEEVKEEYKKRGYSVVAFTDHEVIVPHTDLTDENFVAITAYEIATNGETPPGGFPFAQTYHVNLYAKDPKKDLSPVFTMSRLWPPHAIQYMTEEAKKVEWPREYSIESMNKLIARANADGFLVCYNHPNWSLQDFRDYVGLKGLWGVECYNTGATRAGFPDTMQPIDDLLHQGEKIFPVAADDAHAGKENPSDCFGGYVMVKAETLEYGKIMEALEKGDFYASTGPEIKELYLEDGVLHVKTGPSAKIEVITERRERWCCCGEKLTEASFDLSGYMAESRRVEEKRLLPYFRVNVFDGAGNQANTRAFFEEDWNC